HLHMLGSAWRELASFDEILDREPTFIRFLGERSVTAMRREFGDRPLSFRYERWADVTECAVLSRQASKRNALARLCADFQIAPERVLAIGDSPNDLPMLRWAGIGVAMGNAPREVKEAVQHITAGNTADGVAQAIDRFVPTAVRRPA
ncbi:MAG: HAD family hydrolase, partial [Vulcanimicrobiaceae bacterium]